MVSEGMNLFTNNQIFKRLNPCCYGRWSQSHVIIPLDIRTEWVLILVVMEDGLREVSARVAKQMDALVLILVVMEDGLRVPLQRTLRLMEHLS